MYQVPSQNLPLLHVNQYNNQQNNLPFNNLNKFLQRLPPPSSFTGQMPFQGHQQQQPPSFSTPQKSKPPLHFLLHATSPSYDQIPWPSFGNNLTNQSTDVAGFGSGFPLLRFQSPWHESSAELEKSKAQQTRNRLLDGFHAKALQMNKENLHRKDLSQQEYLPSDAQDDITEVHLLH